MRKHRKADLRSRYPLYLELGFIASLLLLIILFNVGWSPDKDSAFRAADDPVITIDELPPTRHVETPPPPPRPRVPLVVPDETELDDEPLVLDPLFQPPLPDTPPPDEPATESDDVGPEVFVVVEEMPKIVGGMAALYEHLVYPEMARRAGVEGTVVVQFVVDETGAVMEPKVLKGLGAGLDELAVEAVKKVRFTPGRQRGKSVSVRMSVPIVFRLR